jgi:chromosome segregation ATPase
MMFESGGGNPMDKVDLQWLAGQVDEVVESLKTARSENKDLLAEKKELEQRLSSLEKQLRQMQKEGDRIGDLVAQNKEYKKKFAMLKSRVASMLAKVEVLQ